MEEAVKINVKGEYHNGPMQIHFAGPANGLEIDDWKAEFLLRDAPGNFEIVPENAGATPEEKEDAAETKALDAPTMDKQVKHAPKKK